eukprot:5833963-Ditylum_brightwellii.AAC.1
MVNDIKCFNQVHKKNMCGQGMLPSNLQSKFQGVERVWAALRVQASILTLKSVVMNKRVDAESKDRYKDLVQGLKQTNRSPLVWVQQVTWFGYQGQRTFVPQFDIKISFPEKMEDFCDVITEIICTSIYSGFFWVWPLENYHAKIIRRYSCGARCLPIAHAHDGDAHFVHRGWVSKAGKLGPGRDR